MITTELESPEMQIIRALHERAAARRRQRALARRVANSDASALRSSHNAERFFEDEPDATPDED